MFRSIRWRIATAYIGLIVLSLLLISGYLLYSAREHYQERLASALTAQARLMADQIGPAMLAQSAEEINSLAGQLGRAVDARVVVVDGSGRVLGDSGRDASVTGQAVVQPVTNQVLAVPHGEVPEPLAAIGGHELHVAAPVQKDGAVVGAVQVSQTLSEVDESFAHLVRTVALGAGAAAVLAFGLAVYLSELTVRPMRRLMAMAQAMATGKLDQRISVATRDEVGQLGGAFNQMAAKMRETVAAISGEGNRMSAILSNMADGVLMTNAEGLVTVINPAAAVIMRVTPEKALGHTFIEVVRDHELDEWLKECLRRGEAGQSRTGLVQLGLPRRQLRAVVTPVLNDQEIQGLVVLQDVTELQRMETVRREFIANVSHELRTPLASVKALVETLQEGALEDPDLAKDFLGKMDHEVDEMTQMVRELLELSRIESGQVELRAVPEAIEPMVRGAVERLRTQAARAGVDLTVDILPNVPMVTADAKRVQEVLINLVHNAIKFTPPGGRIVVTADSHDGEVTISVRDTGIGIPPDDLPRIFERFYKADKSRASGGTGLGLAIAKHLVQAHGGRIWAESVLDQGSVFSFTLPASP